MSCDLLKGPKIQSLTTSIRQTTSIFGREVGAEDGPEVGSRTDDGPEGKDEHRCED